MPDECLLAVKQLRDGVWIFVWRGKGGRKVKCGVGKKAEGIVPTLTAIAEAGRWVGFGRWGAGCVLCSSYSCGAML